MFCDFWKFQNWKNVSENNRDSCRSSQVGEICEIPAHDMKKKVNFLSIQGSPDSPPVPSQNGRENMIIGEEIWVNRKSFLESIFPFSEYQINFFEMIFNSHLHTFELVTLPYTHLLGRFLGSVWFDRLFLICYLGNHKCWWSNRTYITDYRYTYSRKHSHFINWPLTSNPL